MAQTGWNLDDIPDLMGKVIIVTGGNSGLGYESVKAFYAKGAEVILASRSLDRGNKAKNEIVESIHESAGKIQVMQLDLMDLRSVRAFADGFMPKYSRLDVLMNNAGIMMNPYTLTKDGFESQMGTNHLGHFALTGILFDLIKSTPGSRMVSVSSNAHKLGEMDFYNFLFEDGKGYTPMKAYGRSKLANLLFTYELQRRVEQKNLQCIAVAAHPGMAKSDLARFMYKNFFVRLLKPMFEILIQSAATGALPQIRAAVDPDVKGGEYYGPGGYRQAKGPPVRVVSNKASHNEGDAKKLWELSEQLTGIKFI